MVTPFPDELRPLIEVFQAEHSCNLSLSEQFHGYTDAYVALVHADGRHKGSFIIKSGQIPDGWDREGIRHKSAQEDGAFKKCVPELIAETLHDGRYVLLMRLAGGSTVTWRPVVPSEGIVGRAYARLAEALWPATLTLGGVTQGADLVRGWLGYQLNPAQGGRIQSNLTNIFGSAILHAQSFLLAKRQLPNPWHFANEPSSYPARTLQPVFAPMHGDCHPGNVFLTVTPSGYVNGLCLIDLATYRSREAAFFDNAYFELAILLKLLPSLGDSRWIQLADSVASSVLSGEVDLARLHIPEKGFCEELQRGHKQVAALALKHYHDGGDDVRAQGLLARVAAGLAFINKPPRQGGGSVGVTGGQYEQSLFWAAIFLDHFLKHFAEGHVLSGRPIDVRNQQAVGSTLAPSAWEKLHKFDSRGLNVLILTRSEESGLTVEELTRLFRLPWHLVLDLSTNALDHGWQNETTRPIRQTLPTEVSLPELKVMARGTLWYFANGRQDVSEFPPTDNFRQWRQNYFSSFQRLVEAIAREVSPASLRVMAIVEGIAPRWIMSLLEEIDARFPDVLAPVLLASEASLDEFQSDIPSLLTSKSAVLQTIQDASDPIDTEPTGEILLPQRAPGEPTRLKPVPRDTAKRVGKDLTLVHRQLGDSVPIGRALGKDLLRGMRIEWCELERSLDVRRDLTAGIAARVRQNLENPTVGTVTLPHEPSAGGTTISRRLAWDFMDHYPVVVLNQLSEDTRTYLSEIFRLCSLPLLVITESEVITETQRSLLRQQLMEDNSRAVFLWVARTYEKASPPSVLKSTLTKGEAASFRAAYFEHVKEPRRREQLDRLAQSQGPQCSAFFFGLTAFEESFLGLDRLVSDTLGALDGRGKELLCDLALVSTYSSDGFPTEEFQELCDTLNAGAAPFPPTSPVAILSDDAVRVPHALIAKRLLRGFARDASRWQADLKIFADRLLDHMAGLRNRHSDRVIGLVTTLFVTRDTVQALEHDTQLLDRLDQPIESGNASHRRHPFSPLIRDIANAEIARGILLRLVDLWPDQPHFAVHCARHLLYEQPQEIDEAIRIVTAAVDMPDVQRDHSLLHSMGMCYRARMDAALTEAKEWKLSFDSLSERVRQDFEAAVGYFESALAVAPHGNEYGHVATIQTVSRLLRSGIEISQSADLGDFLAGKGRRWCADALNLGEQHISAIRNAPTRALSKNAELAIADWDRVFGDTAKVVENLRELALEYPESSVRRALVSAILTHHRREWRDIPVKDLDTIKSICEDSILSGDFRESDVRTWFRAARQLPSFSLGMATERMVDWQRMKPEAAEPVFYLSVFYFLRWLNRVPPQKSYADESLRLLRVCQEKRPLGTRNWSYEWLVRKEGGYSIAHFRDLPFSPDPPTILRNLSDHREVYEEMSHLLARVEGVVREYKGPQHAILDLGHGIRVRFQPLDRISVDDVLKRASGFVSFGYDVPNGWDVQLVK